MTALTAHRRLASSETRLPSWLSAIGTGYEKEFIELQSREWPEILVVTYLITVYMPNKIHVLRQFIQQKMPENPDIVNETSKENISSLQLAVENGNCAITKLLLSAGADTDSIDPQQLSFVSNASEEDSLSRSLDSRNRGLSAPPDMVFKRRKSKGVLKKLKSKMFVKRRNLRLSNPL